MRSIAAGVEVNTTPRRAFVQPRTCAAIRAASPWTTGGDVSWPVSPSDDALVSRATSTLPSITSSWARCNSGTVPLARHVAATTSVSSRSSARRSSRRARTRSGSITTTFASLISSSSVRGSLTKRPIQPSMPSKSCPRARRSNVALAQGSLIESSSAW